MAVNCRKRESAIIFSADVCTLVNDSYRLAPTYIGARRVRPSTKEVQNELKAQSLSSRLLPKKPPITFKVIDEKTGAERRMTTKEKKAAKVLRAKQHKEEKGRLRREVEAARLIACPAASTNKRQHSPETNTILDSGGANSRYLNLTVDTSALEQELADLRGERNGVPPVALPSSLALQATQQGLWGEPCRDIKVTVDDDLARQWATALKKSMFPAEQMRVNEDMRDMPYHLVPEVWSRMRPPIGLDLNKTPEETSVDRVPERSVAFIPVRHETEDDFDRDAVVQALYKGTGINISCGASFGCDFLLYDGNRSGRHAFAGLRVLHCAKGERFPLPTAYNMAGFVRCLNSASKLALIAFVEREQGHNKVAFVDLALEKLTTRGPQKTRESVLKRRYQNLAKS